MTDLEKNYAPLREEAQTTVKDALVAYYYNGDVHGKEDDLQSHLVRRLENDRNALFRL